jgi:hypothetical protein
MEGMPAATRYHGVNFDAEAIEVTELAKLKRKLRGLQI